MAIKNNNDIISGIDDSPVPNLKLYLEEVNGGLVAHLMGYVDTYNSQNFQAQGTKIYNSKFKNVIFDMSGVNYLSSTGIGSFVNLLKESKKVDGKMILYGVQPKVYEVFQLLGFTTFFDISDSMEKAMSMLYKKEEIKSSIFPKIISCPSCNKRLNVTKPGKFRCPTCKIGIGIDDKGAIHLI